MSMRSGASVCQDFAVRSVPRAARTGRAPGRDIVGSFVERTLGVLHRTPPARGPVEGPDRKSTRLNSSHVKISYAVFCLKKIKNLINKFTTSFKNEAVIS